MDRQIGIISWLGFSDDEAEQQLYTLCETIGDATEAIRIGMIENSEREAVEREIAGWKQQVRTLLQAEGSWEPANGDWRMGCY